MENAGYELHRSTAHVVVRWTHTPTTRSVEALSRELAALRRAAGAPLALVIVIPTERAEVPSADARKALQDNMGRVFDLCRSIDVVILGSGVRATLMRTALRAMAVVTRSGDRVSVHTVDADARGGGTLPPALAAALGERPPAPPA